MRRAGGYLLLELAIGMAILGTLVTLGLLKQVDDARTDVARAQGQLIKTLNDAVNLYQTNHQADLLTGASITGVADPLHPTVPELVAIGSLNGAFNNLSLYGSQYLVSLALVPPGCVSPACVNVQGVVYLDAPILGPGGTADELSLSDAVLAAGADSGYARSDDPSVITGYGGTWSIPNPSGTAGILAMRNGMGSTVMDQYLPRNGSRKMTGTLNLGEYGVVNNDKTVISDTGNVAVVANDATMYGTCGAAELGQLKRTTSGQMVMCRQCYNVAEAGLTHSGADYTPDGSSYVCRFRSFACPSTYLGYALVAPTSDYQCLYSDGGFVTLTMNVGNAAYGCCLGE